MADLSGDDGDGSDWSFISEPDLTTTIPQHTPKTLNATEDQIVQTEARPLPLHITASTSTITEVYHGNAVSDRKRPAPSLDFDETDPFTKKTTTLVLRPGNIGKNHDATAENDITIPELHELYSNEENINRDTTMLPASTLRNTVKETRKADAAVTSGNKVLLTRDDHGVQADDIHKPLDVATLVKIHGKLNVEQLTDFLKAKNETCMKCRLGISKHQCTGSCLALDDTASMRSVPFDAPKNMSIGKFIDESVMRANKQPPFDPIRRAPQQRILGRPAELNSSPFAPPMPPYAEPSRYVTPQTYVSGATSSMPARAYSTADAVPDAQSHKLRSSFHAHGPYDVGSRLSQNRKHIAEMMVTDTMLSSADKNEFTATQPVLKLRNSSRRTETFKSNQEAILPNNTSQTSAELDQARFHQLYCRMPPAATVADRGDGPFNGFSMPASERVEVSTINQERMGSELSPPKLILNLHVQTEDLDLLELILKSTEEALGAKEDAFNHRAESLDGSLVDPTPSYADTSKIEKELSDIRGMVTELLGQNRMQPQQTETTWANPEWKGAAKTHELRENPRLSTSCRNSEDQYPSANQSMNKASHAAIAEQKQLGATVPGPGKEIYAPSLAEQDVTAQKAAFAEYQVTVDNIAQKAAEDMVKAERSQQECDKEMRRLQARFDQKEKQLIADFTLDKGIIVISTEQYRNYQRLSDRSNEIV
jgi:hypothetical protein